MFSYMKRGRDFYRNVLALAIPIVLQNLITTSMGLLDTFMVGTLGETPLAAVTLANVPIFVEQLMIFGFQSGSSVLISQFYGKKDEASISQVLGIGLYISGGLTLLFSGIMCFFPVQFMGLFGNDAVVVELAARYIRIVAFSVFFGGISEVYIAAHRSMANPKLGLYILAMSVLSNTFFNWVFIFGKLGVPAMGVEGAALATLMARLLQFFIALLHGCFNKRFRIQPGQLLRPSGAMLRRYIHYATPVVLNETFWGLGTALYPTIMGHMDGSQAILAAYGISGNIEKLATTLVFAVGGTTAIIIGNEIGAGRKETVYDVGLTLDTLAFLTGLVTGLVMIWLNFVFFLPTVFPFFHLSEEAADIASMMNIVTFACLSLRAFNSTNVVGVLRGGGDVRAASFIDLSSLWLVSVPLAALSGLVFHWGILAVCLCRDLDNLIKAFLGVARLRSGVWIRDVTVN